MRRGSKVERALHRLYFDPAEASSSGRLTPRAGWASPSRTARSGSSTWRGAGQRSCLEVRDLDPEAA